MNQTRKTYTNPSPCAPQRPLRVRTGHLLGVSTACGQRLGEVSVSHVSRGFCPQEPLPWRAHSFSSPVLNGSSVGRVSLVLRAGQASLRCVHSCSSTPCSDPPTPGSLPAGPLPHYTSVTVLTVGTAVSPSTVSGIQQALNMCLKSLGFPGGAVVELSLIHISEPTRPY